MIVKGFKIKISKWKEDSRFKMTFFSEQVNSENLNEKENKQQYSNSKDYSLNNKIFKISLEFKFMDCQRGEYKGSNGECTECEKDRYSFK
jgi:hypothetical protein